MSRTLDVLTAAATEHSWRLTREGGARMHEGADGIKAADVATWMAAPEAVIAVESR